MFLLSNHKKRKSAVSSGNDKAIRNSVRLDGNTDIWRRIKACSLFSLFQAVSFLPAYLTLEIFAPNLRKWKAKKIKPPSFIPKLQN